MTKKKSLLVESTTEEMEQRETVFSNEFCMALKTRETTCPLLAFALLKQFKIKTWSLGEKNNLFPIHYRWKGKNQAYSN